MSKLLPQKKADALMRELRRLEPALKMDMSLFGMCQVEVVKSPRGVPLEIHYRRVWSSKL